MHQRPNKAPEEDRESTVGSSLLRSVETYKRGTAYITVDGVEPYLTSDGATDLVTTDVYFANTNFSSKGVYGVVVGINRDYDKRYEGNNKRKFFFSPKRLSSGLKVQLLCSESPSGGSTEFYSIDKIGKRRIYVQIANSYGNSGVVNEFLTIYWDKSHAGHNPCRLWPEFFGRDESEIPEQSKPVQESKTSTAPSQTPYTRSSEPIAAPTINVGDKYTYETTSTDINGKVSTYESVREVTTIDSDRVTVALISGKSGKKRTLIYDRSLNIVETGDSPDEGMKYDPPIKYFDFPLITGKKWTSTSTETDKKTGKIRQHIVKGEVIGWDSKLKEENFGDIDTIKIKLNTELLDGEVRSTGTDISWYAPAYGRSLYSELIGQDAEGRQDKRINLLKNFKEIAGH